MNKRGDFTSMIIMIAVVIALAIAVIIFSKVFLMVTGELKTSSDINFDNDTIAIIEVVETKTIPLLDFFIFFSLVALMIGLIISSIYIDVHPAVTVIFIVALIVGIFLAGVFSNVFYDVTNEPEIASTAAQFTMTNMILGSHFPIIILVIGIIVIVILYGKSKGQSQGSQPV